MDEKQRKRMVESRTRICLSQDFWHSLVLRLDLREEEGIPTAATDGESILYNPAFIASCSDEEIEGIWVHETMHCALGHIWRLQKLQNQMKANFAADYAINPIILDAGYHLPQGALFDENFKGKSAEWIYDQLPDPPKDKQAGPPGQGECIMPPPGVGKKPDAVSEQDWKQALQDVIAHHERQGTLPAGLGKVLKRSLKPRTDPLAELFQFVSSHSKDDFSWRRVNRTYAPHGLILPSLYSDRIGPVAVWIDTSGSCWKDKILSKFLAWAQAILDDFRPQEIRVYQGDAKLQAEHIYEPGEDINLDVKGGGGTNVAPIIKAMLAVDDPPVMFIGLSDLYAEFGDEPPVPVAWVTQTPGATAPFGKIIHTDI